LSNISIFSLFFINFLPFFTFKRCFILLLAKYPPFGRERTPSPSLFNSYFRRFTVTIVSHLLSSPTPCPHPPPHSYHLLIFLYVYIPLTPLFPITHFSPLPFSSAHPLFVPALPSVNKYK
jgi:hypothetical protein